MFKPVSDLGSLAMDPSLLMVLITKFFSRVKLVRPTDSELSITNTMSRGPQIFSQSADDKKNTNCENLPEHIRITNGNTRAIIKLTTASTRFPDVVHNITFLQEEQLNH